jgi:hypothetical protein
MNSRDGATLLPEKLAQGANFSGTFLVIALHFMQELLIIIFPNPFFIKMRPRDFFGPQAFARGKTPNRERLN